MRAAFGECGVSGVKPSLAAYAAAANASAAPTSRARTRSFLRTGSGILRRVDNSRVRLPTAVGDSYEVYLNGVRQQPGRDFDRVGRELIFRRALAQEGRLGPIRWLSMLLGIAGTYRKHETVDVVYDVGGRRTVATLTPGSDPEGV